MFPITSQSCDVKHQLKWQMMLFLSFFRPESLGLYVSFETELQTAY
jgi:hypothetical protein